MNVLLVWNGPENADERAVLARREVELIRQLANENVLTSVVLCGDRGGFAGDLTAAGASVHVLPVALPPGAATLPRVLIAANHLRKLLGRLEPDVVEATEPMPAIAAGIAARAADHVRAVIYRRQHGGGRMRLRFASRLAAHLAQRTIVSCEAMRALATEDDACRADRIDVATTGAVEPPAVDAERVAEARHSLGIGSSANVISAVSRLRHEKGLDVLIRSLDRIGVDDLHLVVAGSGPEESGLRDLARRSRVPVHFLGHQNDVAVWLHAGDVVAIPSRRQSVGRLTLEAMACGRPIVATGVGGLPEAIADGESGLLVPPENEMALADALRRILRDRSLADRVGRAAQERWRSGYTMARMAASRRAAWERALGTGHA
jgi:glycosyltransferase involved in cell wall biosynthesis